MTIELARDVEGLLQEQLRADAGSDASQLVNELLRSFLTQQKALQITPEIEAWLLESADQPATPLRKEDFDGIRSRARSRHPSTPQ